jgi:PPOX class probable F420-dependent enzyme
VSDAAPAPSRTLDGPEVLRDPFVRELLALRLVAVLGTVAPDGLPHLTPVWFSDGGDCVLMATASSSRKVANLVREPRAALVVHDSRAGFEVRGVSMTGRVAVVNGADAAHLVERVHARYVGPPASGDHDVMGFLAADDVALRFVPEHAWTWDQRGTAANRAARALGGAVPLAPTSAEP